MLPMLPTIGLCSIWRLNHIAELLQFDAKAEVATAQGLERQLAVVKQMRCGMKVGEAVDTGGMEHWI